MHIRTNTILRSCAAGIMAGLFALQPAFSQPRVEDAWIRGTVVHQTATGAFMRITSDAERALVGASTPAARAVEVHEMKHEDGVMKMRAIDKLPLPAGKTVELKPGGFHLMLFDLKAPLHAGAKVPLTLVLEGKDGKRENLTVEAEVRPLTGHAPRGHHGH